MKSHGTIARVVAVLVALLVGSLANAQNPETRDEKILDELRVLKLRVARMEKRLDEEVVYTASELKALRDQLDRIERSIAKARTPEVRPGTTVRRGDYGTIRLNNRLAVRAVVLIDGTRYTVPANSEITVSRSAGTFSYQYWASGYSWSAEMEATLPGAREWVLTIG